MPNRMWRNRGSQTTRLPSWMSRVRVSSPAPPPPYQGVRVCFRALCPRRRRRSRRDGRPADGLRLGRWHTIDSGRGSWRRRWTRIIRSGRPKPLAVHAALVVPHAALSRSLNATHGRSRGSHRGSCLALCGTGSRNLAAKPTVEALATPFASSPSSNGPPSWRLCASWLRKRTRRPSQIHTPTT
jgi:hypothetical protein